MSFSIIVNKQASSPVLDKVAPELKIKDVQEKLKDRILKDNQMIQKQYVLCKEITKLKSI